MGSGRERRESLTHAQWPSNQSNRSGRNRRSFHWPREVWWHHQTPSQSESGCHKGLFPDPFVLYTHWLVSRSRHCTETATAGWLGLTLDWFACHLHVITMLFACQALPGSLQSFSIDTHACLWATVERKAPWQLPLVFLSAPNSLLSCQVHAMSMDTAQIGFGIRLCFT